MEKEDKILLGNIQDKIDYCNDYYMPVNSVFLDMRQYTLVYNYVKKIRGIKFDFEGGYKDAERKVCLIYPEYEIEFKPIVAIRIIKKGDNKLSHRDYLGSILGLGIKREQIGDIIVTSEGADVIVMENISNFIISNYDKVGSTKINAEIISLSHIKLPTENFEEIRCTVSSLRLDNIISAAYKISRSKAQEAIEKGVIYINGIQLLKPEKILKEGDKIVYRGKGKNILISVLGNTNKDKKVIILLKYL